MGEGAQGGADGGETVAAGGGKGAREVEGFERVGGGGEEFGGGEVVVKIGEERDEAEDDGRVGGGEKVATAIAESGDEPDAGSAAGDAVGGGALIGGESGAMARAFDDGGEALLEIVDQEEVIEELLLAGGQAHVKERLMKSRLKSNRSWPLIGGTRRHDRQRAHTAFRVHFAQRFSVAGAVYRGSGRTFATAAGDGAFRAGAVFRLFFPWECADGGERKLDGDVGFAAAGVAVAGGFGLRDAGSVFDREFFA